MDAINTAFPAVDSATVTTLQASTGTIDPNAQNTIRNTINTQETGQLFQALNAAEQNSNNMMTSSAYLGRNMTITSLAQSMTAENKKTNNGARDTYTRQSEINEWAAQNKYDTLFFMQILFLYFTTIVVSLYLRQTGLFPNTVLYLIVGVGLLIVVGVLWNRASFTKTSRDKRYWNRRYIGLEDAGGLAAKIQCSTS